MLYAGSRVVIAYNKGETILKPLHFPLTLFILLFRFSATAEQSLINPQTQGEVTFVSGGMGVDEQNTLRAMRTDYNLSVLFSVQGTGKYVSDVKVSIVNSDGNILLESVSDGPMFLADLKPGRYSVIADREGQVVTKKATVWAKQRSSLSFTWPQEMGD